MSPLVSAQSRQPQKDSCQYNGAHSIGKHRETEVPIVQHCHTNTLLHQHTRLRNRTASMPVDWRDKLVSCCSILQQAQAAALQRILAPQ